MTEETEKTPSNLTPPQRQVLDAGLLCSGFNCVLQMATGSGKTWLARRAIAETLEKGLRAVYVCPTRALAAEVFNTWAPFFGEQNVGIFTGDFGKEGASYPLPFSEAQLLIMTPERLDACTRHWRSHWSWIPEIDLLVVDEFHHLGDGHRGARLEGALMRIRRLNPFLRIVGLSATLGNREELADWLCGVEFVSSWRPVPLSWKHVRFRKADEKPPLLAGEVARVSRCGGKSLVFAQSRRRAEALSIYLSGLGYRCKHHHAGLDYGQRRRVESGFRGSDIDVVVTTSTLEVGLNLPVRQVVLYDLQEFDGNEFRPLRTVNVWQRVGRAGRLGLDNYGEAVLFSPAWERSPADYAKGQFESCLSSFSDPRALTEQIVAECASGLSRNKTELRAAFSQSLASHQGRLLGLDSLVDKMCGAGLLVESTCTEEEEREPRLRPTRLGWICVRHMLSPTTILLIRRILKEYQNLTYFDLLLLGCCTIDCEPILPVSFEELENLSQALSKEYSHLLMLNHDDLSEMLEVTRRRALNSIKMALAIRMWTRTGDQDAVAEEFDCYPFEIVRLAESLTRLLPAMASIANSDICGNIFDNSEPVCTGSPLLTRVRTLQRMIDAGIDENAATLTLIPGIGKTWARRLLSVGISHIEELAQTSCEALLTLKGLSRARADKWISEASRLFNTDELFALNDIAPAVEVFCGGWSNEIDPYRLRRSLSLTVESSGNDEFRVTGGLDPHRVQFEHNVLNCDCPDFAKGNRCKHTLAVRRALNDPLVSKAHAIIAAQPPLNGTDLRQLWMS